MNLLLLIAFNALVLFILWFLQKKAWIDHYYLRKIIHLGVAIFAMSISYFVSKEEFLSAMVIFAVLNSILYYKKTFTKTELHFKHKNLGSFLYPIALFALGLFLYDHKMLLTAGVLLIAADVLPGISDRILKNDGKSLLAGMPYFFASVMILVFVFNPLLAFVSALILTAVERLTPWGGDNLTVPLCFIVLVQISFIIPPLV